MAHTFRVEVWAEFRPTFIALVADFLVFATFWGLLYLVHVLSVRMPLGYEAGAWIVWIHERGLRFIYVLLAILMVVDIIRLRVLRQL